MNLLSPDTGSKKMNKNVLVVLGGAVLAAVLVAMLVQVTLGGKKKPESAEGVQVLVAAKDLKIGHELGEDDMAWKKWSEDSLFKGAIMREGEQDPHEALEGRLDRSFAKGEALVRRGILKETKGNVVAARLKPGERAISIRVEEEDIVAGFIAPGNFVDVILTYDERLGFGKANSSRGSDEEQEEARNIQSVVALNFNSKASETILQNVRVLAINQITGQEEEDDKKKKAKKVGKRATATLAVPIEAAEKLALASEMGNITLAMRGVGDDGVNVEKPAMTDARLISIDNELFAEFQKMKEQGTGGISGKVKIYNGGVLEEVTIK
ncbi:MAG: Flp pilus assembly protein CpaB [Alphaproteobacteria bacterium]